MIARPHQAKQSQEIDDAYASGAQNVLAVLPTGGGKTFIGSGVIKRNEGASCAIAHRQELVGQISLALAVNQVRHRIIGPDKVVRFVNRLHMEKLGQSYFHPQAPCAVAGVDTLIRREKDLGAWCKSVNLWMTDEAHHLLEANKWGKAAAMFPNARGLGLTATPIRTDGKGLGRHTDGVFDTMVLGPDMRTLINAGYLTDYRIFAPPTDLDLSTVTISNDGDYSKPKLKAAIRKSQIVGDVVKHYLRIAPGKLGITFATDVETATDIAAQFNAAGVPAAVVSAETPDADRVSILRRFGRRELLQLVNVDLFGEGFDLPALEVVSMARPTQSYALFVQQFGRALRLMISDILSGAWDTYSDDQRRAFIRDSIKPHAIIIDHVGNVQRHGLPDAPKHWSLDRREKRGKTSDSDVIPTKSCPGCTRVYERIFATCPYCDHVATPVARSGPEFVDGDLAELDAETLAAMRGEVARVDMTVGEKREELARKRVPHIGQLAGVNRHVAQQEAQRVLRDAIALWGGWQRALGRPDSESYRRFYFRYGVDVLTAQALKTAEAVELTDRLNLHLEELATP